MPSLFEIVNDLRWIEERMDADDENGVSYSEELADRIIAFLELRADERNEKLDAYAYLISKVEHEYEVAKIEERRWQEKAAIRERRVMHLRWAVKEAMEQLREKKVETGKFRFSIVGNGGYAPMEVLDEDQVPANYKDERAPVINLERLRRAIEQGEQVPGVIVKERGTHLRIK